MALLIGQAIDARELEQATSRWSPERFASMCNDLVWAVSERQSSKLPSFTERVNAADGGVDAEWEIDIADKGHTLPTPIVGPGWNVFQYKKRDVITQDRKRIISSVKSSLRGALANLHRATGRRPARFILFFNVDLKHDQTVALKNAVLEGYEHAADIHVEVIGAAELAAFLNSQPHLRAAYFVPLAFKTWEDADRSQRRQKLFGFDVDLVGRQEALTALRALVDDSHVRVVVVSGQHDIGKSRLVLEATAHVPHYVVFTLDPRSMKLEDYRALATDQRDILCVVEDPDPEEIERFISEVLGIDRLKTIITLPTSGQAPLLSYGTDERIQLLSLESLTDEDSRKLVAATGKRLDLGVESWILHRAGGNPGVLLAAVSIGERLRSETKNFEVAVGSEFARRIESELGAEALECAKLLSVLTHVGISGRFEAELTLICQILGEGKWTTPEVLSSLRRLEKAGLAKTGGSFAEVTMPLLANYLASELLRGRKAEVFALFAGLDESGRHRFFRRLCQVRSDDLELFWNALFDPNEPSAPFGNFASAVRYIGVLSLIAGAVPDRVVQLLESGLLKTTHDERLVIADETRREIVWALEQLLFREKTSRRALTLVWLLAEAENENVGNNATGVLAECFHPMHRQMPLQLNERLAALGEFTSKRSTKAGKLVAIRAASKALEPRAYYLRHSTGPEPLDKWPVFTRLDAYDYVKALVDLFFYIAVEEESDVAGEALQELPRLVFQLGIQGQPDEAIERFERLVDWANSERAELELFSVLENIDALRESLKHHLKESNLPDLETHFAGYLARLDCLKDALENGTFSLRLKRWAAGWSREHQKKIVVDGVEQYRSSIELNKLAKETTGVPALLTADLIAWLLSAKAPNSNAYFFELGKEDADGRLRSKLEDLGSHVDGARAFSAYWGGWSRSNPAEAESRLIHLAASNVITGDAIAWAAAYSGPSKAILEMLKRKVLELYITPEAISGILYGDWIRNVTVEQFLKLLETIAGPQLEKAALAIDVIGRWIQETRLLERELRDFAWRCLEAVPTIIRNQAYRFDEIASKLAQVEPERGFSLLEKLLRVPHDQHSWNPIDRFVARENQLWNVLHGVDPERAIRTIFRAALTGLERRFWITSDFQEIIDQTNDAEVLIKLASENESLAELIAESTTAARPGFWPLAFKLIEKHPGNLDIKSALTSGMTQVEGSWGPYSSNLTSWHQELERVLKDPATPPVARPWLRDILTRLEGNVAQHVIWEYDEDVNDLRRYIESDDKNSPERSWAIARILKYADWKDIKRMLTVDDIEKALPEVDLPERKRKTLEKALEVWRGET